VSQFMAYIFTNVSHFKVVLYVHRWGPYVSMRPLWACSMYEHVFHWTSPLVTWRSMCLSVLDATPRHTKNALPHTM
jgi:hypothetical protein